MAAVPVGPGPQWEGQTEMGAGGGQKSAVQVGSMGGEETQISQLALLQAATPLNS